MIWRFNILGDQNNIILEKVPSEALQYLYSRQLFSYSLSFMMLSLAEGILTMPKKMMRILS